MTLLVVQKYILILILFTGTSKTPRSGRHLVDQGILLRYSLSSSACSQSENGIRGWTLTNLYWGPVHTYPDIFESATFSFRMLLPSTRIRQMLQRTCIFLNPLSRVEKWTRNKSDNVGRVNSDIIESDDVANSSPVSYRTITQYGGKTEQICRHYCAVYGACSEHILLQKSPG